jgi:aerobic C4-dicarboxylate transport protein
VIGVAGMEDIENVGKTGGLALMCFEVVGTIALLVGLVIINVLKPGASMNRTRPPQTSHGHMTPCAA